MDVWIEFKNASKWQAGGLFRNFFPSSDADTPSDKETLTLESELDSLELPSPPSPASSTLSSLFSDAFTGLSSASGGSPPASSLSTPTSGSRAGSRRSESVSGPKNEACLPPAVEEHIAACVHNTVPLSATRLAALAKQFADSIPDEEFSVAALQGCECLFLSGLGPTSLLCLFLFSCYPDWDGACQLRGDADLLCVL